MDLHKGSHPDLNSDAQVLGTQEIQQIKDLIREHEQRLEGGLQAREKAIIAKVNSVAFNELLGIKCLELDQGFSHLEIETDDRHANWNGTICGGVMGALIDIASGAAIETLIDFEEEPIATISMSVNFLTPAHLGKVLCAKATSGHMYQVNGGSMLRKENSDPAPVLDIPCAGKKLVNIHCSVITKPDRTEVATGTTWFVVFGKRC